MRIEEVKVMIDGDRGFEVETAQTNSQIAANEMQVAARHGADTERARSAKTDYRPRFDCMYADWRGGGGAGGSVVVPPLKAELNGRRLNPSRNRPSS